MKQSIRTQVLERDKFTCQECGAQVGRAGNPHVADAEVHHKTPRSENGTDEPENLITLCRECHNDRHSGESGRPDERRSILTDREKEILAGDADVTEKYYYVVVTRVRNKIQGVEDDLAFLEEHHPDLADELDEVVCDIKDGDEDGV